MSRATVYDVARLAGVSIKTVSRVVNGSPAVAPLTRIKVEEAVRELAYLPNSNALSLKTGSSTTVGVVVDSLADPFFATVVSVVEDALVKAGYTVVVAATHRDPDREREQILSLARHRLAALLLVPNDGDHDYLLAAMGDAPVVLFDRAAGITGCDLVRVDDRGGARTAVEHLMAAGHREIAYLGDGPKLPTAADRLDGYREAHEAAGLAVREEFVRTDCDWPEDATRIVRELLAADNPPTALFGSQVRATAGALRALHTDGRTDCAIVGFGDVTLGDLLRPALTYIDQNPTELAAEAARILLDRLAHPVANRLAHFGATDVVLPLSLVPRGSGEIPR